MGEPPFTYRDDRTIADASGTPLARCYADRGEAEHGPLFAAAPGLLEALQAMLRASVTGGQSDEELNSLEAQARAAIAKARGEAA